MSYRNCFYLFIACVTLFRLFYIGSGPLGLIPDEAHYWEWSRRLDLSYYSKGPAVAYIIALTTAIFGHSEFGVRIGAVLLSLCGSLLVYSMTRSIFGGESGSERAAFFAVVMLNITPLYATGSILMTTDAPFILAWGLTVYLVRQAVSGHGSSHWYLAGFVVGLGLLSKYIMGLILPCLVLYLLFSRDDRQWLFRKEPYVAFIITILTFTPVILWNIRNGWVTIRHTMGQAHVEAGVGFSPGLVAEFIGGQAGLITPLIFIGLIYAVVRCGLDGFRKGERDYLLLFFLSAPVLLFFLVKSGQGKVQGNWAAAGYFTAFIAAGGIGDTIYRRYEERQGGKKTIIAALIYVALFTSLVASALIHYPRLLEALGRDNVLRRAPYNRIVGWREAGREVGEVYREMEKENRTFIVSDTYQSASELAFYVERRPTVYNVYLGGRRMNQYDVWPGFETLKGWDALYVKGGEASIEERFAEAFDKCRREVKRISDKGEVIRVVTLFRCYRYKGMSGGERAWSY